MSELKVRRHIDEDTGIVFSFYGKSEADKVIQRLENAVDVYKSSLKISKGLQAELSAKLCESKKTCKAVRRALWLARAERAKDRAKMCDDFAYLGDTERNISMTLARTWMKCRMLIPSEWSKVWKKVERKCRAMADKF